MGEGEHDWRFETRNIKLASALLVMGIELAKQPILGLEGVTSLFFKPGRVWDQAPRGEISCQEIEAMWDKCLEEDFPEMPWLRWMLRALRARDFVLTKIFPTAGTCLLGAIVTDDPHKAAVFDCLGASLIHKQDRRYYLKPITGLEAAWAAQECPLPEMQWGKAVLMQQRILMERVEETKRKAKLSLITGPRKKQAIISQGMHPEGIRSIMRELHNPEL